MMLQLDEEIELSQEKYGLINAKLQEKFDCKFIVKGSEEHLQTLHIEKVSECSSFEEEANLK